MDLTYILSVDIAYDPYHETNFLHTHQRHNSANTIIRTVLTQHYRPSQDGPFVLKRAWLYYLEVVQNFLFKLILLFKSGLLNNIYESEIIPMVIQA